MKKHMEVENLIAETTSDPRWLSIVARDKEADGRFVYSVKTTGVYCRPSCGARLARPANVVFHDTIEAAEEAGFRACRRRPAGLSLTEVNIAKIEKVCRLIERTDGTPSLEKLAKHAGMSVFIERSRPLQGLPRLNTVRLTDRNACEGVSKRVSQ